MEKKIGVIFADPKEYNPFFMLCRSQNGKEEIVAGNKSVKYTAEKGARKAEVIAVQCGIGKVNAANAAAYLIYGLGVEAVLNAGLSGAVSGVCREDIVAGTTYTECDFDLRAVGYELAVKPDGEEYIHHADEKLLSYAEQIPGMKTGKLGTGDIFLADSEKKHMFKEMFDLTAFDMESAAIAAVCSKNSVPFLSIRKISDDADDTSMEAYREMNDREEIDLSKLIFSIIDSILAENS